MKNRVIQTSQDTISECAATILAENLRNGATISLNVASGSMRPTLLTDDVLTVTAIDGNTTSIGDIVIFRKGGTLIAHRLLWRKNGFITTAGDACSQTDGNINLSAVIGKAISIRRGNNTIQLTNRLTSLTKAAVLTLKIPLRKARSLAARKLNQTPRFFKTRRPTGTATPVINDNTLLSLSQPETDASQLIPAIENYGWQRFYNFAAREGLAELIFRSLRENNNTPPGELAKLKKNYYATFARNTLVLNKLETLQKLISGISFLTLKGHGLFNMFTPTRDQGGSATLTFLSDRKTSWNWTKHLSKKGSGARAQH